MDKSKLSLDAKLVLSDIGAKILYLRSINILNSVQELSDRTRPRLFASVVDYLRLGHKHSFVFVEFPPRKAEVQKGKENQFTTLIINPGIKAWASMSLLHRISSLHVCNVITGWLWASVNKTNAQSKKKSHYCLRLTADCQVSSWIHYRDSFRLSRIDSYLFLKDIPPHPTRFDRSLISISLLEYISFHQAPPRADVMSPQLSPLHPAQQHTGATAMPIY